jgi:hypothetical protein
MVRSAIEQAARELCRVNSMAPNVSYQGRPMWQSYIPEVLAVLDALWHCASDQERLIIERWMEGR